MTSLQTHYKNRAKEYENIYFRNDKIRQKEQEAIKEALKKNLKGKKVLEVACGTGFWTQEASKVANSVVATDAVKEVLQIAKTKKYNNKIKFKKADAYDLPFKKPIFNAGLANLWLSHIPKNRLNEFFKGFHKVMQKGSIIFVADNNYNPKYGGKLIKKPNDPNTYKLRLLKSGEENLVLKNYFSKKQLVDIFSKFDPQAKKNICYGKNFWYLSYKLK